MKQLSVGPAGPGAISAPGPAGMEGLVVLLVALRGGGPHLKDTPIDDGTLNGARGPRRAFAGSAGIGCGHLAAYRWGSTE